MSTTFRTTVTPSNPTPAEPKSEMENVVIPDVEVPYSEYEKEKGTPFIVEHYDLGRFWNTGDIYTAEVATIQTYIDHLVSKGEINNTTKSVSDKLKSIEKMINVKPDDRKAAKVGKVAAYIEFLLKADNITKNTAKYAMI